MILARVTPVTHSVGNCVKRVVVIVTSVLFFRTPVSPINSLGKTYIVLLPSQNGCVKTPPCLLPDSFIKKYLSISGTGIALAGVFLYSRVKKIKPKTA